MALFLSESVQEAPVQSLQEAHLGLIEAFESIAELNEGVLRADFAIHERTRGLEEAAIQEAEAGFFTRVATKVKEMIIKVRDKVVAFFRAIGAKLSALWKRITGSDATITIASSGAKLIDELAGKLDSVVKAVEGANGKDYTKNVGKAVDDLQKTAQKAANIVTSEKKARKVTEVKVSSLNKIQATANRIAAIAGTAKSQLDKEVSVAEKAASAKDAGDEAKEALEEARGRASAYTRLAQTASLVSMFYSSVVAIGAVGKPAKAAPPKASGSTDVANT